MILVETISDILSKYLQYLGLPYQNILVEVKQRHRAIVNINEIIHDLSEKVLDLLGFSLIYTQ